MGLRRPTTDIYFEVAENRHASLAEVELTTDGQLTVTVYVDGNPVTDTLNLGPGARLNDACCLHSCCGTR